MGSAIIICLWDNFISALRGEAQCPPLLPVCLVPDKWQGLPEQCPFPPAQAIEVPL